MFHFKPSLRCCTGIQTATQRSKTMHFTAIDRLGLKISSSLAMLRAARFTAGDVAMTASNCRLKINNLPTRRFPRSWPCDDHSDTPRHRRESTAQFSPLVQLAKPGDEWPVGDSNAPAMRHKDPKSCLSADFRKKCESRESNPDALRHWILSPSAIFIEAICVQRLTFFRPSLVAPYLHGLYLDMMQNGSVEPAHP